MIEKKKLERTYKELLEEKLINHLAVEKINDGTYGIENLDYRYLVQDLIENEPELFC